MTERLYTMKLRLSKNSVNHKNSTDYYKTVKAALKLTFGLSLCQFCHKFLSLVVNNFVVLLSAFPSNEGSTQSCAHPGTCMDQTYCDRNSGSGRLYFLDIPDILVPVPIELVAQYS